MKVRILRTYGELKKDQIIDADGNKAQFLLENGIGCVAPNDKKGDCNGDCDECEDCKGKKKKSAPAKPATAKKPATKKATTTKKKTTTKKPASK